MNKCTHIWYIFFLYDWFIISHWSVIWYVESYSHWDFTSTTCFTSDSQPWKSPKYLHHWMHGSLSNYTFLQASLTFVYCLVWTFTCMHECTCWHHILIMCDILYLVWCIIIMHADYYILWVTALAQRPLSHSHSWSTQTMVIYVEFKILMNWLAEAVQCGNGTVTTLNIISK